MRSRVLFATAAATALLSAAPSAIAQQTPAPPPAPTDKAPEITITGQRAAVRTSIDRKTYRVSADLAGIAGSVSDVLRNLPSIEVEVDGTVALRGDRSVQILIDGKRSNLYPSGASLQQLPANLVESIEVMTNPSAEFSPDGTGGIINIVMKEVRTVGRSGTVQASTGTYGRSRLTARGAFNSGKLSVTASATLSREASQQSSESNLTTVDPIVGLRTEIEGAGRSIRRSINFVGSTGVTYTLSPRDRLSLSGYFNLNVDNGSGALATDVRRDAAGAVISDFTLSSTSSGWSSGAGISSGWQHSFARSGETFSLNLNHGKNNGGGGASRLDYAYSLPPLSRVEERESRYSRQGDSLTAAYTRPVATGATLKTGYDYSRVVVRDDRLGLLLTPAGAETILPNLTYQFVFVEKSHQPWITWQQPMGKLTVLGGLRAELSAIEYDQRTTALSGENDYIDLHPSLHLQYLLSEAHVLRASYSHRVQRPQPADINPFVVYSNEFSANAGNPNLRPTEAHSLEAGWDWREGPRNATATVYFRENYNIIGPVNRFLTPTVILSTVENQGTWRWGGFELTRGGTLRQSVTWRLTGTGTWRQSQRSSLAGGARVDSFGYGARGTVDWRASDKDLFQVTGSYYGKSQTPQGYSLPSGYLNLGYQRKVRPDLIFVAVVSDVFDSGKSRSFTDTPSLFGQTVTEMQGRLFNLSLTRTLGGQRAPEGQFTYDVAPG